MKKYFVIFVALISFFVFHGINCKSVSRQLETITTLHLDHHKESDLSKLLKPNLYVVSGHPVEIEEFPWIVFLTTSFYYCGGSIVSEKRVVTAAHCTFGSAARDLVIRAGSKKRLTGGQVVPVSEIVIHPQYDQRNVENDISILYLQWYLEMSTKVRPIGLPEQDQSIADGTLLEVAGWGHTSEFGSASNILMAATVPFIGSDRCVKMYEGYTLTDSMMCAGFAEGGTDSCQGDSGGPVTLNREILVGIVSWGLGCARPNKPGVNTNVASFASWIVSHL